MDLDSAKALGLRINMEIQVTDVGRRTGSYMRKEIDILVAMSSNPSRFGRLACIDLIPEAAPSQ